MSEDNIRESQRANKGIPPVRLGFEKVQQSSTPSAGARWPTLNPHTAQEFIPNLRTSGEGISPDNPGVVYNTDGLEGASKVSKGKSKSILTVSSVRSERMINESLHKFNQEIDEVRDQLNKTKLRKIELDVEYREKEESCNEKILELQQKAQTEDNIKTLAELRKELRTVQGKYTLDSCANDNDISRWERKISRLEEASKIAALRIQEEEENNDTHYMDSDDAGSYDVEEWADQTHVEFQRTQENANLKALARLNEDILDNEKKAQELANREADLKRQRDEIEIQASAEQIKTRQSTPVVEGMPQQPIADAIAAQYQTMAIQTQALQELLNRSNNSGESAKFLARQSYNRELPMFSGRPEEWPQFISDFNRTTIECGFNDANNMSRLRKCLKDDAKDAVEMLMISPDNLGEVMEILESRFGKPEYIVKAMIDKARKVPDVKEDKPETILKYSSAVVNMITLIKTLKCDNHLNNPTLLDELESKLSPSYKNQWLRWVMDNMGRERSLTHLKDWLKRETDVALMSGPIILKVGHDGERRGEQRRFDNRRGGNQRFNDRRDNRQVGVHVVNEVQEPKRERKPFCDVCEIPGHWITDCRKFKGKLVSDRWKTMREKKLCYTCLHSGHQSSECTPKKQCGENGCDRYHHKLLHDSRPKVQEPRPSPQPKPPTEQANAIENIVQVTVTDSSGKRSHMGIVPVDLGDDPKYTVSDFAFLDQGSEGSLMEEELREELRLDGVEESFCMATLTSRTTYAKSRRVSVGISGTFDGAKRFKLDNVRTLDKLNLKITSQNVEELQRQWPHLRNIPLESFYNIRPRLLIGSCHSFLIAPLHRREAGIDAPVALKSRLGWYLNGPTSKNTNSPVETIQSCHVCEPDVDDDQLHQLVKKHFTTEDFGVKIVEEKVRSKEDQRAMAIMDSTTKRVEGTDRFETGLLWKREDIKLPESYGVALNRLVCQERKMDKDASFGMKYCEKMLEYEKKGFIRRLSKEDTDISSDKLWYLPHFGVVNPMKPDKLRLVFDAAAKTHGTSLNDALVQGPNLMNSLVSVLWKFRTNKIAFTGDIKDMFHRVLIRDEDLPSQRFLWRGKDRDRKPDVYQMNVMVFGAACSPSSAQFVKNLNASEFKEDYPDAFDAILNKIYVDDYLDSKPTEELAIKIIREVTHVNSMGGFQVCNWMSNSREVMESIPVEQRAAGMQNLEFEQSETTVNRVLGLYWDSDEDVLTFVMNYHRVPKDIIDGARRPSKREVLKLVMSIYDQLGIVAHFTVKAKILMQDIWRSAIGWDDSITDELDLRWKVWLEELPSITQVKIPRCYSIGIPYADLITLHLFCDASEKAFASVAFLVVKYGEQRDCAFVSAKTRVAPLRPLTIPKLELQAALMSSRLSKTLNDEMEVKIDETHYWTDSTTVLHWIRSDARRYKQFVSHRVGEILETSDVTDWHWVPTKLNVADDATRDSQPSDLSPNSRWFLGEEFIKMDREQWPKEKPVPEPKIEDLELKCEVVTVFKTAEMIWELPNIDKFSGWLKLIRSTAFMRRFIKNMLAAKSKIHEKQFNTVSVADSVKEVQELTVDELNNAEKEWWKKVQSECFAEELWLLNGNKSMHKSRLRKLAPFIDADGIIRSRGRITAAPGISDAQKFPVILDPKHPFTQRLVHYYHVRAGHQGRELVANELRKKYWILDISAAIKKTWVSCNMCKLKKVRPNIPEMGDLPVERLTAFTRPFENTGMDYFGPMEVTVGRRHEKRYGVLFTCLVTRAVHVEIAASLDTDSAIMAIRRMICRRGQPKIIMSDNGTNLRGADAELKRALTDLNQPNIQQVLTAKGIEWKFIPPAAPHMGGSWERLVGSFKKAMRATLHQKAPREEILQTLFTEAENMLNSRPLTHVSVDVDDPASLTPNHFLLGWANGLTHESTDVSDISAPVPGVFDDDDLILRKKWRVSQRLADHFWKRWQNEYLPTLNKRVKWNQEKENVKVGDVVLILDDQRTRNHWPKGIIEEVFPGEDGKVRVVQVRSIAGTYKRPVAKVCVLVSRNVLDERNTILSSEGRMLRDEEHSGTV